MQHSSATHPVILTGDRTNGPLHIGHYVGSLKNRVALQTTHQQYLLLADAQALTDNAHNPGQCVTVSLRSRQTTWLSGSIQT